jgi:alkylation response protein AidB-like acyl-CoA dehydrogenase
MTFLLNEDQKAIAKMATDFVGDHMPVGQLRDLRDLKASKGFVPELWSQMSELGFPGMMLDERWGGLDLGFVEIGLVMECFGKNLASTPMLSTALLGGLGLQNSNNAAMCEKYLPDVASGKTILALAAEESVRFQPYRVDTRATKIDGNWQISGCKQFVINGDGADAYLMVTRTSGDSNDRDGLTLFLIPAETDGITKSTGRLIDSRLATSLSLDQVLTDEMSILGEQDRGADLLDVLFDFGTIVLCAEMLGGMQAVFEQTLGHLKERRQFGVAIGSFQGLQHRAAAIFCEIELSKSIVRDGLNAADAKRADLSLVASIAKARCNDAFVLATKEAVQMHGGMGVTDELDIGFFLKRARVCAMTFGDSAYHRERFARLRGF